MEVRNEINEYTLYDELWSGGRDTLDDLTVQEVAQILEILEECQPESRYTLTEINDIFWFERDWIAEILGYSDYEELMNRQKGGISSN